MRIRHFRVEQLRRFHRSLTIASFDDGLNLFIGPNESGKSTLVRGLRAAFLERHRSSSVQDLRPWGDSGAAPQISVHFEAAGRSWQVTKRFLRQPRCDLLVDGERFSGDGAEERLAHLLGYEMPSRGASRPEHQGIPGLLWIEQGDGHRIHEPVQHAGDQLKSVLGSRLGELASRHGDALLAEVEVLRGRLLTGATGRPTGELRQAEERWRELEAEYTGLMRQVAEYRDRVDELDRLGRRHRQLQTERPWEKHEAQARTARERLAAVAELERKQEQDHRERAAQRQTRTHIESRLTALQRLQGDLDRRQQELADAEAQLANLELRGPGLEERLEATRGARDRLGERRALALQARRRRQLGEDRRELEEDLAARREHLACARALALAQSRLRQSLAELPLDPERLTRLQTLARELDELAIRRQTLATRLQYELEPGRSLRLGEAELRGLGEAELLQPETLHIEGVGRVRILPGGHDVERLDQAQRVAEDERQRLLRALGVASLEEAEERHRRAADLEREARQQSTTLGTLAPRGVEALAGELERLRQRRDRQAAELAELQAAAAAAGEQAETDAEAVEWLEAELRRAEEALTTATSEVREAREARIRASQARDAARREHDRLLAEQRSPERQAAQQALPRQLEEATAALRQLDEALQRRQEDIDRARPEQLRQDVARLEASAAAARREADQCQRDLDRLQAALEAQGADGLEERTATCRAESDHQRRRHEQLERRARALDHLRDRLLHHRRELTRQLQAPLQRHLGRYLDLLFPGARLTVDEDLVPERLHRDGPEGGDQAADYEALSFGAREQMSLISRLAYADLLKAAGRPTLIVLDDALVHTDEARMEQMRRILYDAARRHQILLFTCQPDRWQGLGVAARRLACLEETVPDALPTGS